MATVGITLSYRARAHVPVLRSQPNESEAITSSATSQQTTMVADLYEYWRVAPVGGAVWVLFGTNPTAVAGSGYLCSDGSVQEFEAVKGDKAAVVDA